jgi:hypothetical protein
LRGEQGWGNTASVAGGTAVSGMLQSTMKAGAGPAAAGITITPGAIVYVIERCEVSPTFAHLFPLLRTKSS